MTKETEKLIRYGIAVSPIFLGVLLLIFGDASDSDSLMVFGLSVSYSQMVVVVLFVLVIVFLVFYNKRAYDPNPAPRYKKDPRFVDQALIVSLWFFGALGVLVSGLKLHLEIYFQTITALAVMYVLLVAFRIDRLVRRTAEEEDLTLDLMGEALYWRTIYQRDVEAVIGPWRGLSGYREKIENLVIAKKEKHLKKLAEKLAKKTRKELPEEFAKNPLKEIVEIRAEEYVKEFPIELAQVVAKKTFEELAEIFGEKYAKELTEIRDKYAKERAEEFAEELAKKKPYEELAKAAFEGLAQVVAEELAKKTPEERAEIFALDLAERLVEEYAKKTSEKLAKILERKKKKKYQSPNIKYIPSYKMGKEFAEELVEIRAGIFIETLAKLNKEKELVEIRAKEYVKEIPKRLAERPPKELAEKYNQKPPKELAEQFVKGFNAQTSTALADMFFADIAEKLVQEYAKKTPEELAEILEEKKKEKDQSSNIKYISSFGMNKEVVEEFAKELAKKFEEPSKEFEETKKENFRDRITDECAKNLLAGKVMTEVMEKIDKGKPEKELIDAYRVSMKYIDSIEEWEIEKVNRPARDIQMAKFHMQNLEKDKPQGWEMEKAKLKRQMQEWEEEKDNHQEKTDGRIVKLKEFQTDFTKFINSRRQGKNLTERIAIGLIGLAFVALMHLGFPEDVTTGVGTFSVHLFTLFTSTIVVFLFFRIRDLENDRRRSLHDVVPGYFGSEYSELWKEVVHRIYESPDPRWIVTISAVTTIVYVLLLWDKLVSPFPFLY